MLRLDTCSTAERSILDLRPLRLAGAVVIGHYHYRAAHPALPSHAHEKMLEICFLARGEQTYRVRGQEFHLRGGDVFLAFPGEPHDSAALPEEKGDLYWVLLDMRPNMGAFLGCDHAEGIRLRQSLLTLHPRQFKGPSALKSILDDAFTVFDRKEFAFRKTAITNGLVRFLLEIIEYNRRSRISDGLSPEIAATQHYIEAHLTVDADLGLAQLASRAGMSMSRFKSRFRRETGIPPAEYVLRRKVEKAKGLLSEGRKVIDVALTLGFCSSQHFATVFRRFLARCPRTFLGNHALPAADRRAQARLDQHPG